MNITEDPYICTYTSDKMILLIIEPLEFFDPESNDCLRPRICLMNLNLAGCMTLTKDR